MKKFFKISLWIIIGSGIVALLSFVNKSQENTSCWKFEVEIERENGFYFVDEDAIKTAVYDMGDSIVGTYMSDLDVSRIRQQVKSIPAVKTVQVVKSVDGRLTLNVTQRTPIARILNKDGSSFYLDSDGRAMPLSETYTAQVPVLYGNLSETAANISVHEIEKSVEKARQFMMDDLFRVVSWMQQDPFWSAQIESLYVNQKREIILMPRVGDHRIIFGDATNIEKKFKKLMAFYKETINAIDLNQYETINLKYRDQVVCRKYY